MAPFAQITPKRGQKLKLGPSLPKEKYAESLEENLNIFCRIPDPKNDQTTPKQKNFFHGSEMT